MAGEALHKHLCKILPALGPALLIALAESQGSPEAGQVSHYSYVNYEDFVDLFEIFCDLGCCAFCDIMHGHPAGFIQVV